MRSIRLPLRQSCQHDILESHVEDLGAVVGDCAADSHRGHSWRGVSHARKVGVKMRRQRRSMAGRR